MSALPGEWRFEEYEDGEYHLDPLGAGMRGFYEDYFCSDGEDRALVEKALRDVSNWRPLVEGRR